MENDHGGDDKVHMAEEYSLEEGENMVGGEYRMEVLSRVDAVHRADVANSTDDVHRVEEVEHRTWVSDDGIHMSGRLEANGTV